MENKTHLSFFNDYFYHFRQKYIRLSHVIRRIQVFFVFYRVSFH